MTSDDYEQIIRDRARAALEALDSSRGSRGPLPPRGTAGGSDPAEDGALRGSPFLEECVEISYRAGFRDYTPGTQEGIVRERISDGLLAVIPFIRQATAKQKPPPKIFCDCGSGFQCELHQACPVFEAGPEEVAKHRHVYEPPAISELSRQAVRAIRSQAFKEAADDVQEMKCSAALCARSWQTLKGETNLNAVLYAERAEAYQGVAERLRASSWRALIDTLDNTSQAKKETP